MRIKTVFKVIFVRGVGGLELQWPINFFLKLIYWIRFSKWYVDHPTSELTYTKNAEYSYAKRYSLYESVVARENLAEEAIDYLEFGVYQGKSLRWWVERITHADARFYGFDSFYGLPENWNGVPRCTFTTEGQLPDIRDPRCSLEVGLFQHTLPVFLTRLRPERRTVVHLDADLYTSTLFVLTTLGSRLKKGDILLFDDFSSPPDEFRAFYDFASSFYIQYEVIGAVNNYTQVCIKLI